MSNVVLEKSFVSVDGQNRNSNKFWKVKVFSDGELITEWGRVGDSPNITPKNYGSEAKAVSEAEKMIKKKLKGKKKGGELVSVYKEIEVVSNVDTISGGKSKSVGKKVYESIANGDKKVIDLVKLLDQQNVHNITSGTSLTYDVNTGLFSTPLGVVGQNNIDEARNVLSKIKPYVDKNDFNKDANILAEDFMRLIPQNIGRRRPTLETICRNMKKFDELNSILDSLQASLDVVLTQDDDENEDNTNHFGVTLSTMTDKKEIDRIDSFFRSTKGKHECSHLKVDSVYSVGKKELTWNDSISNVKELWHGTRVGNVLSILAKGFYIPSANASFCTGRLFSNGVYFADCSTKSLQYSYGTWGNKKRDSECFMFLCDVALGNTYNPKTYGLRNFPNGYDSISALSKDTGLRYNEYVVNNINQIKMKYLIKFSS